jgi:hypothetical protein
MLPGSIGRDALEFAKFTPESDANGRGAHHIRLGGVAEASEDEGCQ